MERMFFLKIFGLPKTKLKRLRMKLSNPKSLRKLMLVFLKELKDGTNLMSLILYILTGMKNPHIFIVLLSLMELIKSLKNLRKFKTPIF